MKPFVADSVESKKLISLYLQFPESSDIFDNIVADKVDIYKGIPSELDEETVRGMGSHFVIPSFLEVGLIKESATAKSGYITNYDKLEYKGLSTKQAAHVTAKRARALASLYCGDETPETEVNGSISVHIPENQGLDAIATLRQVLKNLFGYEKTNTMLRVALIAKLEKGED